MTRPESRAGAVPTSDPGSTSPGAGPAPGSTALDEPAADGPTTATLERSLGHAFGEPRLLRSALTHRSFLNEAEAPDSGDNERLEFLGDALLDFVAGEYLYRRMPDAREGELTAMRAQLVCEPTLARFARAIGLGAHLRLGRGEDASGGRVRAAILCDAFEAVVGALFLDGGMNVATRFVLPFLRDEMQRALADRCTKDAKSMFQEVAQRVWQTTPRYRTASESGPDHEKLFSVEVMVGEETWGVGEGRSKSAAARRAAQAALRRLQESDRLQDESTQPPRSVKPRWVEEP